MDEALKIMLIICIVRVTLCIEQATKTDSDKDIGAKIVKKEDWVQESADLIKDIYDWGTEWWRELQAMNVLRKDTEFKRTVYNSQYFSKSGGGKRAYQDWRKMDPYSVKETNYGGHSALKGRIGEFIVDFIYSDPRCDCPALSMKKTATSKAKSKTTTVFYRS